MLVMANPSLMVANDPKPCRLLVRPPPIDREAAISYLIRIAQANGFSTPRQLWLAMQNGEAPTSYNELMRWMGVAIDFQASLLGPVPHYWKSSVNLIPGLCISDYNHHFMRWCPVCLAESPHLHSIWGLKLQCVCEKHGTPLTDRCPNCGAIQRFERNNIDQCLCGARLICCDLGIAPSKVWALNRWLACGSGCDAAPIFSNLAVVDWHRLVRFLGQFTVASQPERPGQISGLHYLDVASAVINSAADLLDEWPSQFNELLAAHQKQDSATRGLRRSFGRLYRVLYHDLRAPVFQFLRDAFEAYLKDHWWGFVCKRNRSLKSETVTSHPRLTLENAARQAGTSTAVVRHLIQAELIPGVEEKLPSGRHVRSVHQNDVRRISAFAEGAMTLKEAAIFLALPERRVRELVTAGLLTPLISRETTKAAAWLLSQRPLLNLSKLNGSDRRSVRLVSLNTILKCWRLRKGEFIALVGEIRKGRLPNLSAVPSPIGEVFLDMKQVRAWLSKYRVSADGWLSVDQAACVLGLKQQVAYELVANGILNTISGSRKARAICVADIRAFKETYISLAELAEQQKCSPRYMLLAIKAKPVCGPSVDGSRQYFFRRSDLDIEQAHA